MDTDQERGRNTTEDTKQYTETNHKNQQQQQHQHK